jgi:hypothetical protein
MGRDDLLEKITGGLSFLEADSRAEIPHQETARLPWMHSSSPPGLGMGTDT